MLQAQVNYWNLQEQSRHNLVQEGIARDTLVETTRHNKVSENIEQQKVDLGYANLFETSRHNVATEKIAWANMTEAQRHNIAGENETRRHNMISEGLGIRELDISGFNAATNRMNAITRENELQLASDQLEWNKFSSVAGLGVDQSRARSQSRQADASIQQAEAASKNAEVNEYNAQTNRQNAMTNARQADIAQQNADTNSKNASSNAAHVANEWFSTIWGIISGSKKRK